MDNHIGYFVADNVEEIKAIEAEACLLYTSSRSMPNAKNSHSTPTVMEKQKAAKATYMGES